MKVIFLDVDGVLNTQQTFMKIYEEWKKTGERRTEIDLERVGFFKRNCRCNGCQNCVKFFMEVKIKNR